MTGRRSDTMRDLAILGVTVALIPLIPLSLLWRAFVLRDLWGWFVEPAFGLAVPGYAAAIGLMCVVWLVQAKRARREDSDGGGRPLGRVVAEAAFGPAMFWLIGWVCS